MAYMKISPSTGTIEALDHKSLLAAWRSTAVPCVSCGASSWASRLRPHSSAACRRRSRHGYTARMTPWAS